MFKRNESGLIADVATMLTYARPQLARDLAHPAHDMTEELAENFGEYKREWDARRAALTVQGESAA